MRGADDTFAPMAHFDIPLDLPHAGRLSKRLHRLLESHFEDERLDAPEIMKAAGTLLDILEPYAAEDDNPRDASKVRDEAAAAARDLIDVIEAAQLRGDRLGQLLRNIFECLELGEEGARLSLRAGENPASLQRPT
jgi:hypothetical protein